MAARDSEFATDRHVRLVRGGEPPALQIGRLYEEHQRMVGALCRLLLRDPIEAEDAAQQTFLSAFGAIIAGNVPRHPGPWLATIARRECWARSAQRKRRPVPLDDAGEAEAGGRDPLEDAIERADVVALWRAINMLPRRQRKAFLMREFSGLSYAEVAVALGVTESAIEALLVRARRQVRDSFTSATGVANLVLTPFALLQNRLLRLFGGAPGPRTGAATAVGLPVAAKLAATTAAVVAVGSVGVGLRATVFDHHRPSRTSPAGSLRSSLPTPRPSAAAGRGAGAIHWLTLDAARAATRSHGQSTVQSVQLASHDGSGGSGSRGDSSPNESIDRPEPAANASIDGERSAGTPSADSTAPDLTSTAEVPASPAPTETTSSDASPADATSTDGSQTSTTPADPASVDSVSGDGSQTDTTPGTPASDS